ncbi:MAG: 3-deoxy-D-manno-octulosonic acid transferase [Bacteroidota bacterium]|jgi:3-deoxy-D-manno-octulosonic-acid transferase|nr:3-deoxy-D-manno-octulosonic acid transferase [Bacteroidota bacterium]
MRFLYSFIILCYQALIRIASLFNSKARLWISGRKDIFLKLNESVRKANLSGSSIVWFHCASLGEFEQGRPLIEKYKLLHPETKILLTFFSPSGYEIRKNYSGADLIFYLPIDTPANAKEFIDIVDPKAVFFVKYEFWFNYLDELKKKSIPTYLVSGIFRSEQHFFQWYGKWFRDHLNAFTHFFLQDPASELLLKNIGYDNVSVTGDTRFDRVSETAKNVKNIPLIEKFISDKKIIIAGSTWNEDEELLAALSLESVKLIIAPHEIDEAHIKSVYSRFEQYGCILYSKAEKEDLHNVKVLVIDNIGMLSSLYQYGTLALIGGGFGKGIHNILEAAAFGLPVVFGPNYHKFAEAKDLIRLGGAFSVADKNQFLKTFSNFQNERFLKSASDICMYYVESKTGATGKILNQIS